MTDSHSRRTPPTHETTKGESAYVVEVRERASQGNNASSISLGYIYFRGVDGVRRDYGEALHRFKRIKLEDDVTGFVASHIAIIHYRGLGVAKSYRMAAKYLRSATLHGHGKSRVLFEILQNNGRGTLKKPRSAETILRASVRDSKLGITVRFLALVGLFP